MKVFLTGGTGFVGKAVTRALQGRGVIVRCLVRPGSEKDLRGFEAIERVPGDVLRPKELAACIEGCDAMIHLVGIIREFPGRGVTFERLHAEATANVVQVAEALGVRRYLHMSALGTRPNARSRYHQTKWQAEDTVRHSTLHWTIFRPAVIYGPGDGFVTMLARLVHWLPAMPVIGHGRYQLQPVPIEQVAEAFARALELEATVGQTYEAGGPRAHPFTEILDLIGSALGKPSVYKIHQPLWLMRPLVALLQGLPFFPLTSDQLLMLEESNVCDPEPFLKTFNLTPEELSEGLQRMLSP